MLDNSDNFTIYLEIGQSVVKPDPGERRSKTNAAFVLLEFI